MLAKKIVLCEPAVEPSLLFSLLNISLRVQMTHSVFMLKLPPFPKKVLISLWSPAVAVAVGLIQPWTSSDHRVTKHSYCSEPS